MGLEVPRLIERLRLKFPVSPDPQKQEAEQSLSPGDSRDSQRIGPQNEPAKILTRRTGWHLTWDVRKSHIVVDEGDGQPTWTVQVKELPANVQEIIARGGLEKWVRARIESTR
jgi:homoaconitate hydratase